MPGGYYTFEHILCLFEADGDVLIDWGPRHPPSKRFTKQPFDLLQKDARQNTLTARELEVFMKHHFLKLRISRVSDLATLARQCYGDRIRKCQQKPSLPPPPCFTEQDHHLASLLREQQMKRYTALAASITQHNRNRKKAYK